MRTSGISQFDRSIILSSSEKKDAMKGKKMKRRKGNLPSFFISVNQIPCWSFLDDSTFTPLILIVAPLESNNYY